MTVRKNQFVSRRAFLRLSALATAGATLAACAPAAAPTDQVASEEAAPAAADTAVSLWSWGTSMARYRDAEGNDIFAETLKADTGLDLELGMVDHPDMAAKLKAALPAGTGPDLLNTDFDIMGPFWGFVEPLNVWGDAEWGASWKEDTFSDAALSEMELVAGIVDKSGDALYLPGNMQLLGWVYYWIPIFEERGIDVSALQAWDDFEALCQSFVDDGIAPIGGYYHPANLVDWFKSLVEVTGPGQLAKVQVGNGKFTDPGVVEAFDLFAKVYNEYMQEGAIGAQDGNAVREPFWNVVGTMSSGTVFWNGTGERPMINIFTGTPYFGFLNHQSEVIRNAMNNHVGTFLLPGSKGLAATDAGVAMVSASERKDNAWEYMKWRTLGPGAEQIAGTGQPMGAKAIEVPPQGTDFDKNLGEPLLEAMVTGDNVFRRVLCTEVYQQLGIVLPGVTAGQITAEEAAQEVQDAFDQSCQQWVKS